MASWQANIARVPPSQQRCFDAIVAARRRLARAARVLEIVVHALRNEDQVGETEVDCEGDNGGDEAGPQSASEVGDVANKPDGQEGEGDAFSGALFVILNQLGDL